MNKQQLANKIWESANKMRSKIEANEYKDYILGFIFYKFLSDTEVRYLTDKLGYTVDDLDTLTEDIPELVQKFNAISDISFAYKDLFLNLASPWGRISESPTCVTHFLPSPRLINPTPQKKSLT
jgi:type I restriction enzyme M protein